MKKLITFTFVILLFTSNAQNFKKRTLQTSIKEATVYLRGAHIVRKGTLTVPAGKTKIIVKGLSPQINKSSINVNAKGNFTILSVNHRINYLDELAKSKKIDSLRTKLDFLQTKLKKANNQLEVLKEKKLLLDANRNLGGNNGTSITALKQALAFYSQELTNIKSRQLKIAQQNKKTQEEINKINHQISDANVQKSRPTSEVEIRVSSNANTQGFFTISYPVRGAGWTPKYDIRVKNISSPIKLAYKAEVYQNTGINWKNIKLKLSTSNPNESGVAPTLNPWFLYFQNYYGYSQNKGIQMDNMQLDEVVEIRGMSTISRTKKQKAMPLARKLETTTVENQTSVTFEIDRKYSIPSNSDKLTVDLKQHEVKANYQYYTIPKLDKDAFLMAKITGWDQYNLLAGNANLFFEEAYVGKTFIDPQAFSDTLEVSLGRDKNISVDRIKMDEYSKKRTIGSNKVDSRGFKISVRNKKNQSIQLKVIDQIPLATNSSMEVEATKLNGGKLDEKTGRVEWEMLLNPREQKDIILKYEVKYPKKKRVTLE